MHSSLILFALALLPAAPSAQSPVPSPNETKIRGDVWAHRRAKTQQPGMTPDELRSELRQAGLDADDLLREEVAVYFHERPSAAQVASYAAREIVLMQSTWVPPVPGRHPLGFLIAEAPYEQMDAFQDDPQVVRVVSAERRMRPQNALGNVGANIDDVHAGNGGVTARKGAGVTVAIADSGVDLTHPDMPTPVEAFDVTDGIGVANWDTNVANTVTPHGTHVSGTAVGSGAASSGFYVGAAPEASFYFYKVSDDSTGDASDADIIEAVNRAAALGLDVFSLSYGGLAFYMDGSDPMDQAMDAAVAAGTTVVVSAGNEATIGQHDSHVLSPNSSSAPFGFDVVNLVGAGPVEAIQVTWIDDVPGDLNLSLACTNLGPGEELFESSSGTSPRGTESRRYGLQTTLATGFQKTYELVLTNSATSGPSPLVHTYTGNQGTFSNPDPAYTITSPATADTAIAAAAWVHAQNWVNFQGNSYNAGETFGEKASFSSIGPRIDGLLKPEIAAPGSKTISCLDSDLAGTVDDSDIIDNDGVNQNGSGPAQYQAAQGTSMAAPKIAGIVALVLEENPSLEPREILALLGTTTSGAASPVPDHQLGYRKVDALRAVQHASEPGVWVDFAYGGAEYGYSTKPWNTLFEALGWIGSVGLTVRIQAGTSSETGTIDEPVRLEAENGPVTIGA